MLNGRYLYPLVMGVLIAGALAVGVLLFQANSVSSPAVATETPDYSGPRVWYSPDRYPDLALPGGRHETIRSALNIRQVMKFGDYVWDEQYIPKSGPVWIRVDIDRQLISVYRDGHEIGTAVILYGAESKPTPPGTFPILQKAEDYHSRTYDAPMPYMLRLTDDGVAIHGSDVRERAATHGCIGVPLEFARRLFGEMKLGDQVVILKSA